MAGRREGVTGEGLEAEGTAGREGEGTVASVKVEGGVGAGSRREGQQLGQTLFPEQRHQQEGRHRARLEGRSPEEAGPDQSKQGQGQAQGRESPWRWYKVLTKIKGCHKQ